MHLIFANIIPHTYKYFNSEVAASRSEVMPCGIVKLLIWSSEVKCSAYRAEGTLHARSALHLRSILHVPLAEHLVQKTHLCLCRQKCVFCWCGKRDLNPYGVNHTPLKRARLPVPPLSHSLLGLLTGNDNIILLFFDLSIPFSKIFQKIFLRKTVPIKSLILQGI